MSKDAAPSTDVFQASDLASRRRDFIGAGRAGRALLRDTDGFGLVMMPLAEWEAVTEVSSCAMEVMRTEVILRHADVRPAELPYAWLTVFDDDDREEFLDEMRDALSVAFSTHDLGPVRTCLHDWQTTAQALSDRTRRRILTGPGTDEYEEVDAPS
jgi:hypothetical protein